MRIMPCSIRIAQDDRPFLIPHLLPIAIARVLVLVLYSCALTERTLTWRGRRLMGAWRCALWALKALTPLVELESIQLEFRITHIVDDRVRLHKVHTQLGGHPKIVGFVRRDHALH